MRLKIFAVPFLVCIFSTMCLAQKKSTIQKADSVLKLMTLDEKVGQLNQYNDDNQATGPVTIDNNKIDQIKNGQVGSLLNTIGSDRTRSWQKLAMQSRLKIPLLFGQDVVHGFKTTFPIPLAEAASWDIPAIQMSARVAAIEASASGIHWTFAPMVDIVRDPRWGRVMEGAGEDPYLGSLISAARVKGFQGTHLGDTNTLMACVKHFAAYGAAVGGRDYNSVDMSERQLWEIYLPPFKAAVDAGAASFMNSFNDINGIPAVANNYLQRTILKGKWGFKGFIVSDWGSIGELINHGYAKDMRDAALAAITAGTDMDMESRAFKNNLAQLVKDGKINIAIVDDAVKRILIKKFEMGLFDDPYKFSNHTREDAAMNNPAHIAIARSMAAKSIVLLKNDNHVLPLSKNLKKIAFIGPLVKSLLQNKGFWDVALPSVDSNFIVSQWEGLQNKVGPGTSLLYAKGCEIEGDDKSGFSEAIAIANQADVVILSIGEKRDMSGEAKSRSNINIPGVQEELLQALLATGKQVVVLINAGRPLVFNYTAKNAHAILYTWWLGSEAGNAIADVLFGDYNPSAKLPMTFPMSVGQIPIYYNHFNTGRPATDDNNHIYNSSYLDESIFPKFPFGFGLSYTTFSYSNLVLSKKIMNMKDSISVSFTLTNSGKLSGEEVVQLYLCNKHASVVMPVKALKDFQKIMLHAGESKIIHFNINKEKLSFFNANLKWDAEATDFELMIGSSSADIRLMENFELKK